MLWLSETLVGPSGVINTYNLLGTLTGERYTKTRFGPFAYHLDSILDELDKEGSLDDPDLILFSAEEIRSITLSIKIVNETT